MQNSHLLQIENLVKKREKGGSSFLLKVPQFEVGRGEFVGIIGSSGCGKSTFLDILGLILGIDSADKFLLHSNNKIIDLSKLGDKRLAEIRRNHIGYILQSGGLLPFLTVRENILLSGRLNDRYISQKEFYRLVDRLGIRAQIEKKPQYLSGGQRQRVAIARAIIHKPSLILADEPTASVDRPTALEIRDQFRELARENSLTVLMVSHDTQMVKEGSDRVYSFELKKIRENEIVSKVVAL